VQPNVVRIMCPNLRCRAVLGVPAEARGKVVRCRSCGTNIRVPQRAAQPEAKPETTAEAAPEAKPAPEG
jgi:RNase P subunit RPR2